ncbi:Protein of unknown function [Micromonospora echinaurantiaca]|uniref:DUF2637 domain-containing protein n=1 Tax=Micromonospora echinaurantiaca TaxID=47857 RepID=A0A1C5KD34_9ACTN|nr:DUF2637 domain-containing protein [Micromonospora echinaurantiaca]SCG80624.1 Protein of unknown function [Micromonospora echinaurantiaca]
MTTSRPSRGWAYLGLVLGGLVSVAANIAHSFIAPDGAPENWSPEPGAVVSSIVWPLFLFIAIEILARTPWPTGWGWNVLRWVGLPPVALVAAFVSYRHLSGLLDHYNEETLVVWFGPLAVDGLMLMATAALLATGKRTTNRLTAPVSALVPATTAEASSPDIPASPLVRPAAATPATNPAPDTDTAPTREPITLSTSGEDTATVTTVEPTPDTTDTDATPAPAAPAPAMTGPPPALLSNARIVAAAHEKAHGEPITAGQLAVRLRVPTTTAADILTALTTNQPTINDKTHNGTAVGATA